MIMNNHKVVSIYKRFSLYYALKYSRVHELAPAIFAPTPYTVAIETEYVVTDRLQLARLRGVLVHLERRVLLKVMAEVRGHMALEKMEIIAV